jgi:hypothetical protein
MQIIIEPSTSVMRLMSIPTVAIAPKTQSVAVEQETSGSSTPATDPPISHSTIAAIATAIGTSVAMSLIIRW